MPRTVPAGSSLRSGPVLSARSSPQYWIASEMCSACRSATSLAALVLGGAQVLVSSYGNPVLGSLTIVILAVIILRFRTITI